MAAAFAGAVALGLPALLHWGLGKAGVQNALRATARWGFLFFWASYAGGALTTLFGRTFEPAKRHARELGLAFAAVLAVHLSLVAWLCWIGGAPSAKIFVLFGLGVIWVGLLALASIRRIGRIIGPAGWWTLSHIGMNYILFVFAYDFLKPEPRLSLGVVAAYAPFVALVVLGPVLRLLAWLKPRWSNGGSSGPSAVG
jgi:hypothetical protein